MRIEWVTPREELGTCLVYAKHPGTVHYLNNYYCSPISTLIHDSAVSRQSRDLKKIKLLAPVINRHPEVGAGQNSGLQMTTLAQKLTKSHVLEISKGFSILSCTLAWGEREGEGVGETRLFPSLAVCSTPLSANFAKPAPGSNSQNIKQLRSFDPRKCRLQVRRPT